MDHSPSHQERERAILESFAMLEKLVFIITEVISKFKSYQRDKQQISSLETQLKHTHTVVPF